MQVNFVNPPSEQTYKPGDNLAVQLRLASRPENLTALIVHFDQWVDGKPVAGNTGFDLTNSRSKDQAELVWEVFGMVPQMQSGDYKLTSVTMTLVGVTKKQDYNGLMVRIEARQPVDFPSIVDITHASQLSKS
jgi:hypothetical protein